MKFLHSLLLISVSILLSQCNTGGDSTSANNQVANKTTVTQPVATPTGPEIPGIPKELMQKMYKECDYTDYIFHDLPFSMSQDEGPSIRANLNYISIVPLKHIPAGCKAMGRQFFHVNGDIVLEANVYYNDHCKFYVFVDGETPLYANMMSDQGIEFYSTMIQQAMDAQKAAGHTPVPVQ